MDEDIKHVFCICIILHAHVDRRPEEINNGFLAEVTQAVNVQFIEVHLVVSLSNACDLVVTHENPEMALGELKKTKPVSNHFHR